MSSLLTQNEINTEAELVKRAQKDPREFSPLYEKYYPVIFRFIYGRLNDEETTADITSQVFLKALLHLYKWKNVGFSFSAWLHKIALNECREHFRFSKKTQHVVLDDSAKAKMQEEIDLDVDEFQIQKLEGAIQMLSRRDVQLVELRYYESLSFKEIGYLLGITENNAKVSLYRTLKKIKKRMK